MKLYGNDIVVKAVWKRETFDLLTFDCRMSSILYNVCNKAKRRISKQVLQKNKAPQIFRKENISYPLKIWRALFSCNTRFEIHPFALLLPYYRGVVMSGFNSLE